MTRPLQTRDRVRHGSDIGVIVRVAGENALVAWNDGGTCYFALSALTPAPFVVPLDEALAFVARAKATGAHSVAVPMDVLDALVDGCSR